MVDAPVTEASRHTSGPGGLRTAVRHAAAVFELALRTFPAPEKPCAW